MAADNSPKRSETLRDAVRMGFQELRRFLKNKDKSLKLSGYEDVDRYDLGKVLTLEDFSQRDSLIISTAIPTLNFRKASVLEKITDEQGRLKIGTVTYY